MILKVQNVSINIMYVHISISLKADTAEILIFPPHKSDSRGSVYLYFLELHVELMHHCLTLTVALLTYIIVSVNFMTFLGCPMCREDLTFNYETK
jgi:hypothetical protein